MKPSAFNGFGRIKVPVGVTDRKLDAIKEIVEEAMTGSFMAMGVLKEVLSSSDAIFAYTHLNNLNFLPQYDKAPRTWTSVAGTYKVSDFDTPTLYSLVSEWDGLPNGIAPIVPEGAPYSYAYMKGEEAKAGGIVKRGFKTDFTFEAFIKDPVGFIQALPENMLTVALDTEDYETYAALIGGVTSSQQLIGGTIPEGGTVVANAPLSRLALIRALQELSTRKINGRQVSISAYNLIVPVGQSRFVEFWMGQSILEVQSGTGDGTKQLTVSGYNPLASVTVVESEWVTGTNWYLLPTPGGTRRRVLDHATLIGHEAPELRVEDVQGTYVGGASVSPFEGSFANDSATFRIRLIGGGILWQPDLVLWSTGAGS